MNHDGLGQRGGVASVVRGSERPNDGVVASGVAWVDHLDQVNHDLAAVVSGRRLVQHNLVRAFHGVVPWNGQLGRRGVLHSHNLNRGAEVASVVGRSERTGHRVVAQRVGQAVVVHVLHNHRTAQVTGSGVLAQHSLQVLGRTLDGDVLRDGQEVWRRGVLNRDGLNQRRRVACIVGCSKRAGDDVVARGVARRDNFHQLNHDIAAVVGGRSLVQHDLVRALHRVICWDGQLRSSGVLHCDGLNHRSQVASVVCGGECAQDGVVACSVARNVLTYHFDHYFAAIVRCSGIQHWHLVRALHNVILGHKCEFRRRGVDHSDGLDSGGAVASIVCHSKGARDGVLTQT